MGSNHSHDRDVPVRVIYRPVVPVVKAERKGAAAPTAARCDRRLRIEFGRR